MTRARITKAWDTPPEDLPDFSEKDPEVLSSFMPDSFHKINNTLRPRGWSVDSMTYLAGREIHYTFQSPPAETRLVLRLRYIRQRKGIYYCQYVSMNDTQCRLADVLEAL